MATFSWTATTQGGFSAWETAADWSPSGATFTSSPGNDFVISSSNGFTINEIGVGGTAAPDIANSVTVNAPSFLLFADISAGATLEVASTLDLLKGTMNLGTATNDAGVLSMGDAGGGGIINLGISGILEGGENDTIVDAGTTPTEITGAGTVLVANNVFQIGPSVQVAAGDTTKFVIEANATLAFADAVSGGTIVFGTASGPTGTSVLDVAALSTFQASLSELYVTNTKNVSTSYIDFLNVGTTASATLTNITTTSATLTVRSGGVSQDITILGNYTGKFVNYISDGATGTNVFLSDVPCFAGGTGILTPRGEARVEEIHPGDAVLTSEDGTLVPRTVIWTGVRSIDLTGHPEPERVAPIRFRTGALGPDRPHRDLLLSPDHCLFIDGALVPAKLMVNGMTIIRDFGLNAVSYHHIELDRHAVLIADGVEAESYLDTGNRAYFSNAGLTSILHPELGINEHLRCWEADACAPLMARPEAVKPLWERFAGRAVALGFAPPAPATTTDAGIRLEIDGRAVRPLALRDGTVSFLVPDGTSSIRLLSRSINPAVLRPWLDDTRQLGVAIRSVAVRDRSGEAVFGADHPALTDGWHRAEHTPDGVPWRWSAGSACLPIVADGPCVLEIALSETAVYLDDLAA